VKVYIKQDFKYILYIQGEFATLRVNVWHVIWIGNFGSFSYGQSKSQFEIWKIHQKFLKQNFENLFHSFYDMGT